MRRQSFTYTYKGQTYEHKTTLTQVLPKFDPERREQAVLTMLRVILRDHDADTASYVGYGSRWTLARVRTGRG